MLDKLVQKRSIILIIFAVVTLTALIITLFFDNKEDKATIIIASLVLPLIIYGFTRLMFKVVRIKASLKYIKTLVIFFIIGSIFSIVMSLKNFATDFPNGLSPILTADFGMLVALIDEAKKNIEMENNKGD